MATFASAMKPLLDRHPIWGSLANIATSSHKEKDLSDFLWRIRGGGTGAPKAIELTQKEFKEVETAKEDGNVLVHPAPIY